MGLIFWTMGVPLFWTLRAEFLHLLSASRPGAVLQKYAQLRCIAPAAQEPSRENPALMLPVEIDDLIATALPINVTRIGDTGGVFHPHSNPGCHPNVSCNADFPRKSKSPHVEQAPHRWCRARGHCMMGGLVFETVIDH